MSVMEHVLRDAHTHFFSRLFFDTPARQAPGGRPPQERLAEVAATAHLDLPNDDHLFHLERWLQALDVAGVESAVSFASVPEEAEVVGEAAHLSGGRLVAMTVVNPVAPGALELVERALGEWGHRGVVLFPALHRYNLSDDAPRPLFEKLRAHRAVCVVHCGVLKVKLRDLFGLPRSHDARCADPLTLVRAASDFPEVPFVVPHFGGGLFREALLAASWCDNIHFDTSSSNDWMKAQVPKLTLTQVFERAIDVVGTHRVLYGTDSSTFPRGYRSDLLRAQQAALAELGLPGEAREAILGGNLERLLAPASSAS